MLPDPALAWLTEPARYVRQIDVLRRRATRRGRLDAWLERGLSLVEIDVRRDEFVRLLTRTLAQGEYVLSPVEPRRALIGGKWRTLYRSSLTDTIVLGVMAELMGQLCAPHLSPHVYSYRRGRSGLQALSELASYLHQHRQRRPDPRGRGLYVLRRDVRRYGESIPTHEGAPLWSMVEEVLAQAGTPSEHPLRPLLRAALRPRVRNEAGNLTEMPVGVPTGSPIQPAICNLYLTPVDEALGAIEGSFYARFGDDLLFAHPEPSVVREADRLAHEHTTRLGLTLHHPDLDVAFFTLPGRASSVWPEAKGVSFVEYLGCRMDFRGRLGLSKRKAWELRWQIRQRIARTEQLLDAAPPETDDLSGKLTPPAGRAARSSPERAARAAALSTVVANALDPHHPASTRAASLLRYTVTDRNQLRELDYALARDIASTVSGVPGPRAFRSVRYRDLRQQHGLPSLVVARNASQRRRRGKR